MPDATITSTASTFGNITGTFAADQSTVTGTVTGIVDGTLSGSVGVPGPAGAPGQGVPVGGTAGQFLTKIDGTNYNTDWTTVNLSAYAVKANNLSDLADAPTARTNLGLGSLAVVNDAPSNGSQYARKNAAWDVVIPGDRYLTSSTTSNTISNGNKTFTIGTGLSYTPTQNLTISYDASNHMHGEVLTYNSGTGVLTVDINHHTGSGTYAVWVVNVGGVTPDTSVAWGAITGTLSTQTDLQNALDLKLAATTAASTYYPLVGNPSGFLTSAPVTSVAGKVGAVTLDNTDISGLGTMSTATAADYSTTTVADGLYYPLTGNPSGFLTSVPPPTLTNLTSDISWDGSANTGRLLIAGVNDIGGGFTEARLNFTSGVPNQPAIGDFWFNGTDFFYQSGGVKTIASQSYVSANYQPLSGMSSYLTTASAAATYFTIASAANKADLASPTFSGTPTLPTGTIATTQTPGNNTTAVATTAFVTAAVPAFATNAQAVTGTSATTALSPSLANFSSARGLSTRFEGINVTNVAGSGAVTTGYNAFREMYTSTTASVGRAGWFCGSYGVSLSILSSRADAKKIDFSKKIWLYGRFSTDNTGFLGDANTMSYITLGGYTGLTTGAMTSLGIGLSKVGSVSSFINLIVHNGTSQTNVATTNAINSKQVVDYVIYSDGAGNVTLFLDGVQAATTSAGPTGITASMGGLYREQVESTISAAVRQLMHCYGGGIIIEG